METGENKIKGKLTPMLLLSVFTLTYFVYRDFGIRTRFGYAVLSAGAVFFLAKRRNALKITPVKLAALILAAVVTVMSLLPNARTDKSVIALTIGLDFAVGYALLADPGERETALTLRLFMIAGTLMALYVTAVFFFPGIYSNGVRKILSEDSVRINDALIEDSYGVSLGGSVVFADYMMFFGMTAAVSLLFSRDWSPAKRLSLALTATLCLAGVILTGRKGELLVTGVVLIRLLFTRLTFTSPEIRRRAMRTIAICLLLLFIAALLLLCTGHLVRYALFLKKFGFRFPVKGELRDVSSGRLELWKRAAKLFRDSPVTGIGWGRFSDHVTDTYNEYLDGPLTDVHNNYLQLLCETGVMGFILVLSPMVWIWRAARKRALALKERGMNGTALGAAAVTSLMFQTYSFLLSVLDPCWYKIFFWCLYALSVMFIAGPLPAEEGGT